MCGRAWKNLFRKCRGDVGVDSGDVGELEEVSRISDTLAEFVEQRPPPAIEEMVVSINEVASTPRVLFFR